MDYLFKDFCQNEGETAQMLSPHIIIQPFIFVEPMLIANSVFLISFARGLI